jgi:hypothetical protein
LEVNVARKRLSVQHLEIVFVTPDGAAPSGRRVNVLTAAGPSIRSAEIVDGPFGKVLVLSVECENTVDANESGG